MTSLDAPQVGLEPTTLRLTAECSAIELLRNIGIRRRPTLPDRYQSSTIGTEGLNFCVRYGNRWDPFVIATGNGELFTSPFQPERSFRSLLIRLLWLILSLQLQLKRSAPSVVLIFLFRSPRDAAHPDNCTALRFMTVCLFTISLRIISEIKPSTY